ncbi:hypothetical protein [Planomonospora sp. ID82291]|uniref:hypothetical protein n=1 Tax=Planomonospora sp. ID82291 TaxID=2738136 RepID=UPI0018C424C8|nr:hypothetical protein [Planomonospora sp. ID82291]MBG0818296.1 hypothetical protein [Planomonospora sp. ID82291]
MSMPIRDEIAEMGEVNRLVRNLVVEALADQNGRSADGLHVETARPHDNPAALTCVVVHPDGSKSTALISVEFVDWDAH